MRLSDKCHLDGCEKPHLRMASHIDSEGHRHNFCCDAHQEKYLRERKQKERVNGHRYDVV